ncbi:MAG: hypothetical protein JKY96_01380 [Phycisphaerales bacterium]|nr:hypothetical protein [Phycisphaerales bacterium]
MPIHPLPQFEEDLKLADQEREDREAYEKLNAPSTIVVRFGYLRMVGEFPYTGDAKPGCGSKLVVRTHRGTELCEMLTSTCRNAGCAKSVTRKEMLDYIENSGGKQYPFYDQGRVLRIATGDDLNEMTRLEQKKNEYKLIAKQMIEQASLSMKIIEAEPMLGGDRVVFYFSAEDRIDFRDLVRDLQSAIGTKAELRQIGARDEARITADYERCGQYCCCKSFLKVLKPVSMKSAKIQKATLDPLKISGRCGRLMCCLRYEDETYDELRKNLPHRKSRVGTPDGDGMVVSTQILTQLALVRLDSGIEIAVPIENLTEPGLEKAPDPRDVRTNRTPRAPESRDEPRTKKPRSRGPQGSAGDEQAGKQGSNKTASGAETTEPGAQPKKKRRKRKPRSRSSEQAAGQGTTGSETAERSQESSAEGSSAPKKKRRRRKRNRGPRSDGGNETTGGQDTNGGDPGPDSPTQG